MLTGVPVPRCGRHRCLAAPSAPFTELKPDRYGFVEELPVKSSLLFCASCVPLLLAICGAAPAAEPGWKVGLARAKVTPERPVMLAGYAARNHPFEKVTADLFVK